MQPLGKASETLETLQGCTSVFAALEKSKPPNRTSSCDLKNNHFVDVAKSHLFITAINLFLFFIHLFLYMQKFHYVNKKDNRANCFHSSIKHDTSGNIPHWSEFRPCPHVYGYSSIQILQISDVTLYRYLFGKQFQTVIQAWQASRLQKMSTMHQTLERNIEHV